MAVELVFELVDGVMVPRFSGEADGRRFFTLAQAARREKRTQQHMRTLHLQVFAPFVTVANAGNPVAAAPLAGADDGYSELGLAILHRYKYSHLSKDDFTYLVKQCRQWGLSPWSRHVFTKWEFAIGDEATTNFAADADEGAPAKAAQADPKEGMRLRILTTIDGLRAAAARAGRVVANSMKAIPADARIPWSVEYSIMKEEDGRDVPVIAEARWDEFYPQELDDRGENVADTSFWDKMPCHMLEKCAEAKCLRRAFPESLGDLYTVEEWHKRKKGRGGRQWDDGGSERTAFQRRPVATPPGEDPIVDDEHRPQTPLKFHEQLHKMGFKEPQQRNDVIARLQLDWPGLIESDRAEFYRRTLATIRKHPDRYGAKLSG